MKQKLIIVSFFIMGIVGAFSLKAHTQLIQKMQYGIELDAPKPEVIADETTLTETKTGAKIECSNDTIHFKLYQKWQHTFIRYSWVWKKDRKGPYKHYVITISKKDGQLIKEWSKDNL